MPLRAKLFFFTGPACPACVTLKPIVQTICAKHRTKMIEIDATENIELAAEFDVYVLPTVAYKGIKVDGFFEEDDIEALFC